MAGLDARPLAGGGTALSVWVVPGASRDRIAGVHGGALKVQVSTPPAGGRANRRAAEVVAGALGLRKNEVRLVTGAASRSKTFHVAGLEPAEVVRRLGVKP